MRLGRSGLLSASAHRRREKIGNGTFLDIPGKAVALATAIIAIFLVAAYCLHQRNFGVAAADSAYWLNVADALIVGVFFAMLKAIFELPKLFPSLNI